MDGNIENRKNIINKDEIELKAIVRITLKRKWWLTCSAILVLVLEILYIFVNHKDYLLIFNIVTAIFFSIITGALFILAVELCSGFKFNKNKSSMQKK